MGPQVQVNQTPVEVTGANQQLHCLAGRDRGDERHGRSDDTCGVARGRGAGRRHFAQDAAQTARFAAVAGQLGRRARGDDGGRHAVGGDDAGVDPGDGQLQTGIVEQVAGREVVGAVHHQRRVLDQAQYIARVDVGDHRFDGDVPVDPAQLARRGLGLGQPGRDVVFVEERLALQVVEFDEVPVDDAQPANPSARQQVAQCRAGRAAADQDHGRVQQALLAGLA